MSKQNLLGLEIIPLVLILLAIGLPIIGIAQYNYWKAFISDENGYNSILAVVAVCSGISQVITLIFLYMNYIQQNKQIRIQRKHNDRQNVELNKNRKDAEFTRSLDIVYRQAEHTNTFLHKSKLLTKLTDHVETSLGHGIFIRQDIFKSKVLSIHHDLKELNQYLNLYRKVIDDKKFSDIDHDILKNIVRSNLDPTLLPVLKKFRNRWNEIDTTPELKAWVLTEEETLESKSPEYFAYVNISLLINRISDFFDHVL